MLVKHTFKDVNPPGDIYWIFLKQHQLFQSPAGGEQWVFTNSATVTHLSLQKGCESNSFLFGYKLVCNHKT